MPRLAWLRSRKQLPQSGFTLIELMVSLLIGLALVGALLASYLASLRSSVATDALVRMADDAAQALNLMRSQVAMAGFATPTQILRGEMQLRNDQSRFAIFGCARSNFAPASLSLSIRDGVACSSPESADSDTLEVGYEAVAGMPASNAILDADGKPLDCIGNQIPAQADTQPPLYIHDSKFIVDTTHSERPTLNCHPHGGGPGAALVDNIESLGVIYGLSAAGGDPRQVTHYSAAPAAGSEDWQRVETVTICVRVRSARPVFDSRAAATLGAYADCDNQVKLKADGYLRRSFATTVVLQNRRP